MIIDLGKVAITNGGNWNNSASYEALTYVLFRSEDGGDGCGYISLKNNIAKTPGTDPTVWQKATEAGQSIYQLCVNHGTFVGTEEEFVAAYNAALAAAAAAAESVAAVERSVEDAERLRAAAEQQRANAESDRQSAESSRAAAESSRVAAEAARQNASAAAVAAANTAAGLASEKATLANEKAQLANEAAAAATSAAETTAQMNGGLIGLGLDDGELFLVQNAETGTVVSASLVDGEAIIEFNV